MFWTGHQRDANYVLVEQSANVESELVRMRKMRDQADELQAMLRSERSTSASWGHCSTRVGS